MHKSLAMYWRLNLLKLKLPSLRGDEIAEAISTRLCERQPLAASVAWRVAISGIASPVIASRRRSNLCLLFVAIIISFFVSATANIASAKTINMGSSGDILRFRK